MGQDPARIFARVLAHLSELGDLGIGHVMVSPRQPWDEAALGQVASIVPDVHAIPVRG